MFSCGAVPLFLAHGPPPAEFLRPEQRLEALRDGAHARADHRAVDGLICARYLQTLKAALEDPAGFE